eukprot:SAG31_NODE_7912_length_1567_cov_1.410763_2_plen_80_part_00
MSNPRSIDAASKALMPEPLGGHSHSRRPRSEEPAKITQEPRDFATSLYVCTSGTVAVEIIDTDRIVLLDEGAGAGNCAR